LYHLGETADGVSFHLYAAPKHPCCRSKLSCRGVQTTSTFQPFMHLPLQLQPQLDTICSRLSTKELQVLQLGYTLVEPPPGHPSLFAKLSNYL
jgi:hypothetical protein